MFLLCEIVTGSLERKSACQLWMNCVSRKHLRWWWHC